MRTVLEVIIALLPVVTLFICFLVFRLTAFKTSLTAFIVELIVVMTYYQESPLKALEASVWGVLTIWSGFLVVYMGQIFGQAYRNTGLLAVLLESVGSILPAGEKEAKAFALVAVVGGFIGAFNGFAVYPVVIPGLIELGYDGLQAVTAFLVYFSWPQPFVSLFIVPNISYVATHVPVVDIVQVAGLMGIPLVFVSLFGFLKILRFRFFDPKTQFLFWGIGLSYTLSLILFTQIWPEYGVVTLIFGAALSLVVLYGYGSFAKRGVAVAAMSLSAAATPAEELGKRSGVMQFKAYAPLFLGVIIVLVSMVPTIRKALNHLSFSFSFWGYSPINVSLFTSAGFFIFVTALVCYLFRAKEAHVLRDIIVATKRSRPALSTQAVASGLVYLLVNTGQMKLLGGVLSNGGKIVYATLSPFFEFLGGIAFGQGLPADFLLAKMQIPVAPSLGIPLAVLVGIVTVMSEGPPNALKPNQIAFSQSLANLKGKDGEIFRICLKWQLFQVIVGIICSLALVFL